MAKYSDVILDTGQTAYMMGISREAFTKWNIRSEGKKGGKVYYDLRKVIAYKVEQVTKQKGGNLSNERTRLARAQADKSEYELEAIKKRFIPSEIVERVWSDQITNFRARLLSIPNKLAKILASTRKPTEVENELRSSIHEALLELSDYETEQYKLSGESDQEDSEKDQSDIKATVKVKPKRVGRQPPKAKQRIKR